PSTLTGRIHPPDARDCAKCHDPHKSDNPALLLKPMSGDQTQNLCLTCHDVKDAAIVKAHHGQPFEKADCIQCHDARQSNSPKLMQAFLHNPFESKECDDCHQPPKDGKVVLT